MEAAEAADRVTATCFSWRYSPGWQVAWRQIQEGCIRDDRSECRVEGMRRHLLEGRPWRTGLGEFGSHEFHGWRFLTGHEIQRVVCWLVARSVPLDPEYTIDAGTCMLLAELTDGVLGDLRLTMTADSLNGAFSPMGRRAVCM